MMVYEGFNEIQAVYILVNNKFLRNVLLSKFVIVEYYMSCCERCVCCSGVIEPPNHPGGIALI